MGLEAIILTILGIPRGWLTSLTYEKIKAFSRRIETIPLQGLFINSFLKSLDRHKKDYAQGVKKLKKSIKQEGKPVEFLKIL
jgi:hypothetical protein